MNTKLILNLLSTISAIAVPLENEKKYVVCVHTQNLNQHLENPDATNNFSIGDFSGYSISANSTIYNQLKNDPEVLGIEEEQEYFPDVMSWGLDRINERNLPMDGDTTFDGDGDDVDVYVIDTGIKTTIADFGGRAVFGKNLYGGTNSDCHGHGTHVAGTIGSDTYGIAKKAKLIAVKVFGCSGGTSTSMIISAVQWATNQAILSGKRSVINMSLGGPVSAAMNAAVSASTGQGVHNVVAAGNDDINACMKSPASAPSAVTVASSTSTDVRSGFSNWGSCVDIFAPGSSITSWTYTGVPWTISGTSMATPHVAGVAAILLSKGPYTPAGLQTKLQATATNGKISDPKGSINKLLFIEKKAEEPKDLNAPDDHSVVFYYEATGEELHHIEEQGFTAIVPTASEWASMTTDNYKSYRAIILGDPHCHHDEDNKLSGAFANRHVWSPAVTGNIIVHSFDASWHHEFGRDPGTELFLNTTTLYSTASSGTGLYMTTSCYDFGDDAGTVEILDQFGSFKASRQHKDNIHIVDTIHPSLAGSTDSTISNWGNSVHNIFIEHPEDFHIVAINTDTDKPVLLVRDVASFSCEEKLNGYQECFGTEQYHECVWGEHHIRDVAPGTDCCNWSAAQRIILVGEGMTCPF